MSKYTIGLCGYLINKKIHSSVTQSVNIIQQYNIYSICIMYRKLTIIEMAFAPSQ